MSYLVAHLHVRETILRLLNAIGMVCLYAGLFLYQDEEGRFQNRVVQWWVNVETLAQTSRSRVATFMREVARLAEVFLNRLFGSPIHRHVPRLIGISICFSIASFFLTGLVSLGFVKTHAHGLAWSAIREFIGFSALALMPSALTNKWFIRVWGIVVLCIIAVPADFLLFIYTRHDPHAARVTSVAVLAFVISLFFDGLYLYLTRITLRQIAEVDRLPRIILLIFYNVLGLAVVLALPWVLGVALFRFKHTQTLAIAAIVSFVLNSIDVLVASVGLVISLLLLSHRIIWPVIERPLHAVHRFNIIGNKKALVGCGIALITLPTHSIGGLIFSILAKLI